MKTQKKLIIFGAIGGTILLFLMLCIGSYNGLIDSEEAVNKSQSDLDAQLQRRFDLVPQLVATVQGAAQNEQEIVSKVTEARAKFASAQTTGDRLNATGELDSALSRLLVVVENYPNVTSSASFQDLQVQLEGTENRIAQARRDYNTTVTEYNTAIRRFPKSIVASFGGFERRELYQATDGAETAPTVSFDVKG